MLMLTILLVIIAYAIWRVQLYRAAKARFAPQFPNARCLSWRSCTAAQSRGGARLAIPAGSDLSRLLGPATVSRRAFGADRSNDNHQGGLADSTIPIWAVGIDG